MTKKTIVILGGGFGGLATANELRRRLPSYEQHRIILIERKQSFSMGLSNLWIMTGERRDPREGEHDLSSLRRKGIEYLNEEVVSIDASAKSVKTSSEEFEADYIVVALGAELAPQEVSGFSETAYNFYDAQGARQLQTALGQFTSGDIVFLVTRTPFRCPPAPYEAAFLVDALLREKGLRSRVNLKLYTPEPQPMPVAGPEVGRAIVKMLDERNIGYFPERVVLKIDPTTKRLLFEVDEAHFDLLLGVPPHVAPKIVRDAGLSGPSGWIPVDAKTLQTRFSNVFAIGDIAAIKLANGMFLPKAGIFAEGEGRVVAENISSEIMGVKSCAMFSGEGYCFVEAGGGKAAYGIGDFYASPAPKIRLEPPSARYRKEKEEFERSRVADWL